MTEAAATRLRDGFGRAQAISHVQHMIGTMLHDPRRVMEIVASSSARISGATAASVDVLDGDLLVCRAATGSAAYDVGRRVPWERSLVAACLETGEPLRSDDTELDANVDQAACRSADIRSLLVVPLRSEGTCLGTLSLQSALPHAFDDATVELLTTMAGYVTAALTYSPEAEAAAADSAATERTSGLLNRRQLAEALDQYDGAQRLVLFLIEVEGLTGAELLARAIANALRAAVSSADVVTRLGASHFAVITTEAPPSQRPAFIRRLQHVVREAGGRAGLDASIGTAERTAGEPLDSLLERAEHAMAAKKQTRETLGSRSAR